MQSGPVGTLGFVSDHYILTKSLWLISNFGKLSPFFEVCERENGALYNQKDNKELIAAQLVDDDA